MVSNIKKHIFTALKLSLALGLVIWMVATGKLDFGQLYEAAQNPLLVSANFAIWLIAPVFLGVWRWQMLLRGLKISVQYLRCLQLQLIGLFFNTAIPGAVGGDIIKAYYVVRQENAKHRTPAAMTILLDRITGLCGLFIVGTVVTLLDFENLYAIEALRPSIIMVFGLTLAMMLFISTVFIKYGPSGDPFVKFLSFPVPGFKLFLKIYQSLREYRHRPRFLIMPIGLSVILQVACLLYFYLVTITMFPENSGFTKIASIYPLGVLTTAIPITPAGVGVGHAAFEKLFALAGLSHGANVFNIYCLGQIALNLAIGFIPYILFKERRPTEETEDVSLTNNRAAAGSSR